MERRARAKTAFDENPSNAPGGPLAVLFAMAPEVLCRARLGFRDLDTVPKSSQRREFGEPRPVGSPAFPMEIIDVLLGVCRWWWGDMTSF